MLGIIEGNSRQLNRLGESLDCYDRAISLKADYSWAWHNKGYVLELLDRPREALECYKNALEHKPNLMSTTAMNGKN